MDPVIQNLIRQVEKLQSEHEIAKQNFRKGVMKYEHMATLIKSGDFEHLRNSLQIG